ncbi:D-alanyl-D-alanine carboxypeptidase [Neobacillus niacini]|nr:D-alanyl-D-alanine carboxypeptidase family protein [Neobacillus niacini]MCM3767859.1 D-alanyl-D-alanine carboxypeptidase [Neobacillus niacini]
MSKISAFFIAFVMFWSYQANVYAEEQPQPEVISEAACLLDTETNAVLYNKNADVKMYPASLTKIATAIYAIEKGDLDSVAVVSGNAVRQDGTRVYLVEGEQLPLKMLVQGMLVNSGNDAAVAIAEHLDGSVEAFSAKINDYLKTKVGVQNTHFMNPSGLHDENHYTTALDMAVITNYAMKNPIFAEIYGTKKLWWEGQSWKTNILTHHAMLKGEFPYSGIIGGKTGYTSQSKQTLATTADNGKIKLTAVVLKSEQKQDKYRDTAVLFDYGFSGYQHSILNRNETFTSEQEEFFPKQDTVITEDLAGTVKKVNDSGLLTIENHNGQLLQSVQLMSKKETEHASVSQLSEGKKKIEKEEQKQGLDAVNSVYGVLIIGAALIIITAGRKFAKKV